MSIHQKSTFPILLQFYPIPQFRTIIRLDAKATMKPFIPRKKFRFFFLSTSITSRFQHILQEWVDYGCLRNSICIQNVFYKTQFKTQMQGFHKLCSTCQQSLPQNSIPQLQVLLGPKLNMSLIRFFFTLLSQRTMLEM